MAGVLQRLYRTQSFVHCSTSRILWPCASRVERAANVKFRQYSTDSDLSVTYDNGLPVISLPLPSRRELCRFTLRPISNTVGDFVRYIQEEDLGVDRVNVIAQDGTRIAKSTPIDVLMRDDFRLLINDIEYTVNAKESSGSAMLSSEETMGISDVKQQIAHLYSTLNVEEHQLQRERELQARLEHYQLQLKPLEDTMAQMKVAADKRTQLLSWTGLGLMGLQFGVLARLTWWEYSWDIMEPVTYFVTYGTTCAMFAYYVTTRQEYNFADVRDREYLLTLHKLSKKKNFDLGEYNDLKSKVTQANLDLERLRDPLQLQLPIQQLMAKSKAE